MQHSSQKIDKTIYLEIVLLTILCITQCYRITALNLLITACVIMLIVRIKDLENCTIALFAALPLFNLLSVQVGSVSFYYLMIFAFWYRYFRYHNWKINRTKFLVLFIMMVIRLSSGEIVDNLTWFVLFSVLVLTYNEEFFTHNIHQIVFYISVTFVISTFLAYLMHINELYLYQRGYIWSEDGTTYRFAGTIGDPVFFSQFCALLIAANLSIGCYRKSYLLKGIVLSAAALILCIFSYAKTGMFLAFLLVVATLFWFIFQKIKKKRTFLFSLLMIILGFAAAVFVIWYILTHLDSGIVGNYVTRLSVKDLMTGRGEIWKYYISMLLSDWRHLFCAMPDSVYSVYVDIGGGRLFNNTHNVFIEAACLFGIVPTVLILVWIFSLMIRSLQKRNGIMNLMPICVMLASGFTLHGNMEFHYYTLMAIAVAFISDRCPNTAACMNRQIL